MLIGTATIALPEGIFRKFPTTIIVYKHPLPTNLSESHSSVKKQTL